MAGRGQTKKTKGDKQSVFSHSFMAGSVFRLQGCRPQGKPNKMLVEEFKTLKGVQGFMAVLGNNIRKY